MKHLTETELVDQVKALCIDRGFTTSDVNQLIIKLDELNFFKAPASTKYHGAYPGGLAQHSINVATVLVNLTNILKLTWSRQISPVIVGLLHDLCKCDSYIQKPDGSFSFNTDTLLHGHGEKSVIMIQRFMPLNEDEIACILYHMGAFTDSSKWNEYTNAVHEYSNVLWTHTADMYASHIIEVHEEETKK